MLHPCTPRQLSRPPIGKPNRARNAARHPIVPAQPFVLMGGFPCLLRNRLYAWTPGPKNVLCGEDASLFGATRGRDGTMTEISEAARRLKELREQAGLTMRAVSEALGWSLTRYQHYEDRYKRRFLPFELARDLEAIFTPHGVESGAVLSLAGIESGQPVNPRREAAPARAAATQAQRDLPVMGTVAMGAARGDSDGFLFIQGEAKE